MSGNELRDAAETLRENPAAIEDPNVGLVVSAWLAEIAERVDPTAKWSRRSHGWTGVTFARKVARLINGGAS